MTEPVSIRHYFVDEAGDPTLFDRDGRVIAGTQGCSSHFVLGALDVIDPAGLSERLGALHRQVIGDPFYAGVASLKPHRQKTHAFFHAKDDLPEIRERVFRMLAVEDVRFFAVVRDKRGLVSDVKHRNAQSPTYRYSPNKLYDEMVKRLFRDRLHKDSSYRVCFARRGSKDRTEALRHSLDQARASFQRRWAIAASAPIEVSAVSSKDEYCLQATDYFLWALQRLYTGGEDRFVRFLWERFALVHDVDDRRRSSAGRYYSSADPLSLATIEREPGI
jgi:hypothetical protein